MLHPSVEAAFDDMVSAWLRYDEARSSDAALTTLVDMRMALESSRDVMYAARRAHHPSPEEMAEMAFASYCRGEIVFIPYRSVDGERYRCWCGELGQVPA